jgi:hypothetical protein
MLALGLVPPGRVLGLPEGVPDPVYHLGLFRYVLLALVIGWAIAVARGFKRVALLVGVVHVAAAIGFWALALGRPYGLFFDADTTARAAAVSVAAAGPRLGSYLAGEPADPGLWPAAARRGLPAPATILAPTFLPVLAPVLSAALVALLWGERRRAWPGALLWLAFSTGDLEAIRGWGLVPAAWAHPEGTVVFLFVAAVVLVIGRLLAGRSRAWPLAALPCLAVGLIAAGRRHPAEVLLVMTLDQGLWLPLGMWGLLRDRDIASRALALGGAALLAGSADGFPIDAWTAEVVYRLGFVLAATGPILRSCEAVGRRIAGLGWARGAASPAALGFAALLAIAVPGALVSWLDPIRQDPVAESSREPISPSLLEVMKVVRGKTSPEDVVVASPEYAPVVAVLAGRRVLRAPTLASAPDEERRLRAERAVLAGRPPRALVERYGITHVFVAPGDFAIYGLRSPEQLEARGFERVFVDDQPWRLYRLDQADLPR